MKLKRVTVFLMLSAIFTTSQTTFAEVKKPTAEAVKLQKDQIKYKAYIPAKYMLFEAIEGDLNKDGAKDLVLIVKGTDLKQWVNDEYRGKLDRNRRGMIVLLAEKGKYKQIISNLSCFSSENEDGGVYFAPELWVSIEKGLLNVHYGHGRYGYWNYSFRTQDNDLRLIGYDDSSNHGPYVESETSINFLTGQKVIRKNLNEDPEGDPKFKETWRKVHLVPIYLSKIKRFDELDFSGH
ncbi:hypothetical protein [Acinetobacter sp. ANC 4648]|uniref:hypothetical protein n=1 Tax=Acinetobacter sp. ANC 4648 TaxID=1977875 RepID=UPI003A4C6FE5